MNERILESGNLQLKRFFSLDSSAYDGGTLSVKVKELLGLTASLVMRCDDCVTYHVVRCQRRAYRTPSFSRVFNVALVVGGSITIPHLRRAVERLGQCRKIGGAKLERSERKQQDRWIVRVTGFS